MPLPDLLTEGSLANMTDSCACFNAWNLCILNTGTDQTFSAARMAASMRSVAQLADPVGQVLSETVLPNGLVVEKISVSLGVIGIIYHTSPYLSLSFSFKQRACRIAGNNVI